MILWFWRFQSRSTSDPLHFFIQGMLPTGGPNVWSGWKRVAGRRSLFTEEVGRCRGAGSQTLEYTALMFVSSASLLHKMGCAKMSGTKPGSHSQADFEA